MILLSTLLQFVSACLSDVFVIHSLHGLSEQFVSETENGKFKASLRFLAGKKIWTSFTGHKTWVLISSEMSGWIKSLSIAKAVSQSSLGCSLFIRTALAAVDISFFPETQSFKPTYTANFKKSSKFLHAVLTVSFLHNKFL